jgi:MHS family proline/betaine transporter-like MFS transporter
MNPVFIAIFATIVQYYDYALYGFSAVILSKTFFAQNSDLTNLANAYFILALTIFTKPIGSYIVAHIGDKYGRIVALRISTIGIAIPTFIIGIIPSFEAIGSKATLILFVCRMLIGAFASAELDGMRIYIFEKLDKKYSYFGNALVSVSTQIGALCAIFAIFLTSNAKTTEFWRINFLIGGILGLVVFILRGYMTESQEYILKKQQPSSLNQDNFIPFIQSIIILGTIGAMYHFNFIFFGTYCFKVLKIIDEKSVHINIMLMMVSYMICGLISGILCDKYQQKKLIIYTALTCSLLFACLNIIFVTNREYVWWNQLLLAGMMSSYSIPLQIMIQRKVAIAFRYRFYSLAHSIGSGLISTTAPYISTKLYENTQLSFSPSLYLCFLLILITVSFRFYKE